MDRGAIARIIDTVWGGNEQELHAMNHAYPVGGPFGYFGTLSHWVASQPGAPSLTHCLATRRPEFLMTNRQGLTPYDVAMGHSNFQAAALIARSLDRPELIRAPGYGMRLCSSASTYV